MACPFPRWTEEEKLLTPTVLSWREEAVPSDSRWLRAVRARFHLSTAPSHEHVWDLSPGLDAVAILVYVPAWDGFVLVRQFRAAAFRRTALGAGTVLSGALDATGAGGMTLEAVAGLADKKGLSRRRMAVEELEEEIGARVAEDRLEDVMSTLGGVGTAASELTVFYLEARPEDFVAGLGGGLAHEGEVIQQVLLPRTDLHTFIHGGPSRPSSLVSMLDWWMRREAERSAARAWGVVVAGGGLALVGLLLAAAVWTAPSLRPNKMMQ